jgi:hypothetical protein
LGSFPLVLAEPWDVPDSVEVCDVTQVMRAHGYRVLHFGVASKLASIQINRRILAKHRRLFLNLSSPILKAFRSKMEYTGSQDSA